MLGVLAESGCASVDPDTVVELGSVLTDVLAEPLFESVDPDTVVGWPSVLTERVVWCLAVECVECELVLRSIAPVLPGSLTSEPLLESELTDPLADGVLDFGTTCDTVRLTWLSVSFLARVDFSVEPELCDVDTLAEPEFWSAEPAFGSVEPEAGALPESELAESLVAGVTEPNALVTVPTSELTGSVDVESDGVPIVAWLLADGGSDDCSALATPTPMIMNPPASKAAWIDRFTHLCMVKTFRTSVLRTADGVCPGRRTGAVGVRDAGPLTCAV